VAELSELSLQATSVLPDLAMPPSSGVFKVAEDAMVVQIDTEDPAKTVQIGASLNPK
jgi:hypothetical protein